MFDYITCEYPLSLDGANKLKYQTKDTPAQLSDNYKITKDGFLMHQEYDIEDKSERAKWIAENPNKEEPRWSAGSLAGRSSQINKKWVETDFTGKIFFYDFWKGDQGWIEWRADFKDGKIKKIRLTEYEE